MKPIFLFIICLAGCFCLRAQQTDRIISRDSIETIWADYFLTHTQTRCVFIHTDRTCYQPGEAISAKLYQINYLEEQSDTTLLEVGLFNERDSLITELIWTDTLQRQEGFLQVPPDIYSGDYTLMAYDCTDSLSYQQVLCKKRIQVGSDSEKIATDYQVRFFPEGGHLLDSIMCRVGFEAIDSKEHPIDINGRIEDNEGNSLITFKSLYAGIGNFSFIPQANKKYYAVCYDKDSLQKIFPLPETQKLAFALTATWRNDILIISRQSAGNKDPEKEQYLLIYTNNRMLYWEKWDQEKTYFSFSRKQLGQGVLQLVLLDETLAEQSRRTVFVADDNRLAQTTVRLKSTPQRFYRQVTGEVHVNDQQGKPLLAELSVSIQPSVEVSEVEESLWAAFNLSPLYLNNIKYPIEYFTSNEGLPSTILDNRMLTYQVKQSSLSITDPDIDRYIYLKPVEVTASINRKKKHDTSYASFGDYHMGRKEIEKRTWIDIIQIFSGFPGIEIRPDRTLRIRSAKRTPLVVIDNVPLSYTTDRQKWLDNPPFEGLTVEDIESVDILSGNRAAIFGMNGGGGAICITTRRATDNLDLSDWNQKTVSFNPTLYWQSHLQTDRKGSATFSFPLFNKELKAVQVTIEGKDASGQTIISYCKKIDL